MRKVVRWVYSTAGMWVAHSAELRAMHSAVLLVVQKDEQPVDLKVVLSGGCWAACLGDLKVALRVVYSGAHLVGRWVHEMAD